MMARVDVFGRQREIVIAGQPVEIHVSAVSPVTLRVTVLPLREGTRAPVAVTGALAQDTFGMERPIAADGRVARPQNATIGARFRDDPPAIEITTSRAGAQTVVQRLTFDRQTPGVSFLLPAGPLLGLGEGGPQFDRKGTTDFMRNGQVTSRADGYALATHGTRAPVQWLIGTDGWAMFIHQPYGTFDFKGSEGRFTLPVPVGNTAPASVVNAPPPGPSTFLPFDAFVVGSNDPKVIVREYARITGLPEMPPRWAFGYQQSHRTLEGREQILDVARTFREKRLPCDALIYLGTEFAPSGWNTRNGEFTWHPTNFPDPKAMLDRLHDQHFKVVLHIVIEGRTLTGAVSDPCTAAPLPAGRTADNQWPPNRQVSCYWPAHKPLMDAGVDGWWPDQGDGFDGPSRLNRHRMYWEGSQLYAPDKRPYALHRNASPGVQRFGGFIWSGDVQSRWETLKTHVPVAVNTALSGLPYWGTDIGGFYATSEFTGELFVRWFQFGAFSPLFRSHGRNWHLHTPWGWDGGDGGPPETQGFRADPKELRNPDVEIVCRRYLELRYRLMPYLYTAVRDAHETGMPILRAMWLHNPDDPDAVKRGDQYMWGPDLLVAPVVQESAMSRRVYLPRGTWIDFWNHRRVSGGREVDREVDLMTMPIYVRAGAVLPMGPVKQYVDEPTAEPLTLVVYPGASGSSFLYDDDGESFAYRQGAWMRIAMTWDDTARRLSLRMAGGRMQQPTPRRFIVQLAGASDIQTLEFDGRPVSIRI